MSVPRKTIVNTPRTTFQLSRASMAPRATFANGRTTFGVGFATPFGTFQRDPSQPNLQSGIPVFQEPDPDLDNEALFMAKPAHELHFVKVL